MAWLIPLLGHAQLSLEDSCRVADQMLLYQRVTGGWPKNVDMARPLTEEERGLVMADKQRRNDSTTDNKATTTQMEFLARVYQLTGDKRYRDAFCRGVEYLLGGQYVNGGWPQFWPEMKGYQQHITYNDDAMVHTMRLLRDIAEQRVPYQGRLTDKKLRRRAQAAFNRGIECILATQIVIDGEPTVWCQQHDRETLKPAPARAYELPSYCPIESTSIVALLMELPHPDERVKKAVNGAMRWLDDHQLTGVRLVHTGQRGTSDYNTLLVEDSAAAPLWARFYDLVHAEPFVCDRDGVPRRTLEEIGTERRNGYAWYGTQPSRLYPLYEQWKQADIPMASEAVSLYHSFLTPPDSIRVGCYYYWVNERVDPKGVVADLEWMKQNGITLAFLATDIRNRPNWDNPWEGQTFGKNKFRSKLWWKNLRMALKTAGELGIEMGIFNCPGWSQSGGPWVKSGEAMRNWTPNGIEVCKTNRGTDIVCSPCSPEAEGLEVDKLSKRHVQKHFESFIGEILRRIPQKDRPTLTTVVVDSWERGKQNYTDSIFVKFRQRFGYPLDYQNASCKKDLDRLIAELVASEYMGGLTAKAHEYGLRTWCEPYAHSPFPGNSITYGSAADEVAAEFWVDDKKFRKKEVDAALGAARRSGKNRVWAESFTDGWPELAKDDWSFEKLKPIADRYFHAGINASVLHVMISQPGDDREPAVRPWFGTYFDRRSQNAKDLKPLVAYLRRCNFMLQLGSPFSNATDCRIMGDGTKIRFTDESLFEVTFPDGRQELWNPLDGSRKAKLTQ